jgi:hypothetical protein
MVFPGDTVTITVDFNAAVVVGGEPTLLLNDGGTASYAGGSGSTALVFTYTVAASDRTVAALGVVAIDLHDGATIGGTDGATADLSGAATTLTGLAVDPPATYADGSTSAPTGAAQLPDLLSGYGTNRPPWDVAGVDYAVGVPSTVTLKDPSTISMTGVSVNGTLITITASNVTLDGYDFSLNGGHEVDITAGVTNTVIKNSYFAGSTHSFAIQGAIGAGDLTVENDTFNGGGSGGTQIFYEGSGAFLAQYDLFENAPSDGIDFDGGTITATVQYNLFYNIGLTAGSHPDAIQYNSNIVTSALEQFNTIYQPVGGGEGSGAQGLQVQAQNASAIRNTVLRNNVIVATGTQGLMSYSIAVGQDAGNTVDGVSVIDNYIDYSGAYGPFYSPSGTNLTYSGNIDLSTGAVIGAPTGTHASDVVGVSATPGSGTVYLGASVDVALTLDESFIVSGTPTLTLNSGGVAIYSGGSGSDVLTFSYSVGAGESDVGTLAIRGVALPSGASIVDTAGNSANLTGALSASLDLSVDVACFAAGTRIATERGAVTVERLSAGDRVRTAAGRIEALTWVGRRRIDCCRHPRPHDVRPVRVRAGAFGPGRPSRDLRLSPDHAVFAGGALIPIRYLLNGATIIQEDAASVTYYHLELAAHDLLLAEGLACESYLDTGNRSAFADADVPMVLHPDFARRMWDERAYAPLVIEGPRVSAVRMVLREAAARAGYARCPEPDLRLFAAGRPLTASRRGKEWHVHLPAGTRRVRFQSRSWVPAEMDVGSDDARRLGVALAAIRLDKREIRLDAAAFGEGWHAPEEAWRWTRGDAILHVAGARALRFTLAIDGHYPTQPPQPAARTAAVR